MPKRVSGSFGEDANPINDELRAVLDNNISETIPASKIRRLFCLWKNAIW